MSESSQPREPRITFGSSSRESLPFLPLRLVVAADFAHEGATWRSEISPPMRVDRDTFDDVLKRVCPQTSFRVPNRCAAKPEMLQIDIPLEGLKSFHPAAFFGRVEPLARLAAGREVILELRDRKIGREQFLERWQSARPPITSEEEFIRLLKSPEPATHGAPPPPAAHPGRLVAGREDSVDSILSMVEAPDAVRPAAPVATEGAARVEGFIAEILASAGRERPIDRRAAEGLITELDRMAALQIDEILMHPEFRRLESVWRGLKFLVDRTDFRAAIQLELLSTTRENLPRALGALIERSAAAEAPVALVVTDFEFNASVPDMALLREAAEYAERLQAPLLTSVGPTFFGKQRGEDVSRIGNLQAHLESAEYTKWRGFTEAECSRWVGASFNRFLLRARYEGSALRALPFIYKEAGEGLWGKSTWAIASLMTRSFAETGWCGRMTGLRGGGVVDNLPLHNCVLPSGEETQIPLETIFMNDRQYDFYDAGFLVLQCTQNQDFGVLLQAPTVHRPPRYPEVRAMEISRWRATLPYQMVTARIVHHLQPLLDRLRLSGSAQEIQDGVERGLRALMETAGATAADAVEARLEDNKERAGWFDLLLRIRPGPSVWSVPVDIELSIPIRKS